MTTPARRRPPLVTALLALCALAAFLSAGSTAAVAKLAGKEWKEAEAEFRKLFAERGFPHEKQQVLAKIASDESGRAWRVLAEGLFLEVQVWWGIQNELSEAGKEHSSILQKHKGGYTADEENRLKDLNVLIADLEAAAKLERQALDLVVQEVCKGPEALRKNILKRAKGGSDWPYRAAAVRVAVATMGEKGSWSFLQNAIENDKDPRVRSAGLDALADAKEKWEGLVIGRLGDPHWSIVLQAARIAQARELHKAVPHLINALPRASPRVAEALGEVLRALTKENFEPFADVWAKWWEEHQADFESDIKVKKGKQAEFGEVHFYGVPIKSDRVLFIIDISGSMKKPTKNDNPKERWKPPPSVTGRGRPPPPPPPEEILSGPKIDVAKHELKKAIQKLPKEWTFNIICFNHGASHWQPGMMKASEKNKESAYAWIRSLKASGSTYIDGALRMGFQIAGLVNYDKRYPDIHVDTIVLLSDGAPTDNTLPVSKLMDPEVILQHVRDWNKDKAVVIHCIGVDMVTSIEFLKKLAEENGGTYVDR
jgi:hypothetical protein